MNKASFKLPTRLYPHTGVELLDTVMPIEGWLEINEIYTLNYFAKKALEEIKVDEHLIEIGSFKGRSTVTIALACKKAIKGKLITVDPHQGTFTHKSLGIKNTLGDLKKNVKQRGLAKFVDVVQAESKEVFERLKGIKTKLVFIDGSHKYKDVRRDFLNWSSTLMPGGYLIFHDALNVSGPRKVMLEVLKNKNFVYIQSVGDLACFQKKDRLSLRNWLKKIYGLLALKVFFRVYRPTIS